MDRRGYVGEGSIIAFLIFIGLILMLSGFAIIGGTEWQMGISLLFFGGLLFLMGLGIVSSSVML